MRESSIPASPEPEPSQAVTRASAWRHARLIPARFLKLAGWGLLALYLGFAGLVLVMRYAVLPNVDGYRDHVTRIVSDAVGVRVTIKTIDAEWHGLHPSLSLSGIQVHDEAGRPALRLDHVEAVLSWTSLASAKLKLRRLEVDSPNVLIRRAPDGQVSVAGLRMGTDEPGHGLADWLMAQNQVVIRDAVVEWIDEQRGAASLALRRVNLRLQNDGRRHRFGLTATPPRELAARLDVRGDFRGESLSRLEAWNGQAYAELDYADLSAWRQWVDYPFEVLRGRGGVRIWIDTVGARVTSATADMALREVHVRLAPELAMLELQSVGGRLTVKSQPHRYDVSGRKLGLATAAGVRVEPTDFRLQWTVADPDRHAAGGEFAATNLDVSALARLAEYLPFSADFQARLGALEPRGKLAELNAAWSGDIVRPERYSVRTRFDRLALNPQGKFPGFSELSGKIEGNEKGGTVTLSVARGGALFLPAVFSEPRIGVDALDAQLSWTITDGRVEVEIRNLTFANADAAGTASGRYRSKPDSPGEIDVSAKLTRGEAAAAWRYVPLVVSREVREWLKTSVLAGRSDDAQLRLQGDLKDFPFAPGRPGIFRVTGKFSGGVLRYVSDWPEISGLSGDLLFEGTRMLLRGHSGKVLGASTSAVSAEIPDMNAGSPLLRIQGVAGGPTAEFLRFVDVSPISEMIDHYTNAMSATGNGNLQLKLDVPLSRPDETMVQGELRFTGNTLILDSSLPRLSDAAGRVQFTNSGITIPEFTANLPGLPFALSGSTRADGVLQLDVQGNVSVAALRRQFDWPLLDHLGGTTAWRGTVGVRKKAVQFVIQSGLQGIASSLPEPFNKITLETLPLRLERTADDEATALKGRGAGSRETYRLTLGQTLNAFMTLRRDAGTIVVERGGIGIRESAPLPERGIAVTGTLESLNVDAWRRVLADQGGEGIPLQAIALKAGEITAFGQSLTDLTLRAGLQNGAWSARIASRELTGDLLWTGLGKGRLRAQLKQLVLNDIKTPRERELPPESESVRELPAVELIAEDFSLRGRNLGRLELHAVNQRGVWRMDRLAIANPDAVFSADGQWRATATAANTEMNFKLDVAELGRLLDRLGYPDTVRRGTAKLEGRVSWSGAPTNIDYPTLEGNLLVEAAKGQFNKLNPGAGRLLGILSLQALPRRVSLDFRDVFSEGFAFDTVSGSITARRGVMEAEDFLIQGPAAKVAMSGSVNLVNETQNLRVRVQPALAETVSVGAAALLNPLVGAAALLAQKVLQDPLSQIFSYEYAVTGGWSDPKVEKLAAVTQPNRDSAR